VRSHDTESLILTLRLENIQRTQRLGMAAWSPMDGLTAYQRELPGRCRRG